MRTPPEKDSGYSLVELLVSLSIMSVVMVVVTTAVTSIYAAVNQTEGISFSRDQLGNTFRKLDKELRYAQWLSTPGQVGTRWYLEFATPLGCRQLKLDGAGVLTLATWTLPGVPGVPVTVAGDITPISGTAPFTVYAVNSMPYASASPNTSGVGANFAPDHAQVRLQWNHTVGRVVSPFDVVFTAENTSRNTSPLNGCSAGRPAT